jgi:Zn-dependent peptidase ImmA (M78 family)
MEKYKNEGFNKIVSIPKFSNIDFTKSDDRFVVPVGELCEQLGLDVEFMGLKDGHSGYFDSSSNTIVVNDTYPATRNLFTIAHEIGHYVLHGTTENRFDSCHKYTREERTREVEANEFAAKLLMPSYKFVDVFKQFAGDCKKVSYEFGVSVEATKVRALNLGLIDNI